MAQGFPPRRSQGTSARRRREDPDEQRRGAFDYSDADPPPWAGPGIYPSGPGRREIRPPAPGRPDERAAAQAGRTSPGQAGRTPPDWAGPEDGGGWPPAPGTIRNWGRRAAAARARKSRRRLLAVTGLVVVAIVVVLAVLGKLPFQGQRAAPVSRGLVTTFQPGEFRSVPNACQTVSAATISQYLPGKVAQVSQALGSSSQSQCTWTLDVRPDFRVLTVTSQAYAPSLLATGDGSATFNAIDAYGQQAQALGSPPKSSRAPKAQLGAAPGLGSEAFTALQVFRVGGDTTDEVTVVLRDRNVVISVTMQGQEHGGGFGPVPVATLQAAALAAAHEALAGLR